MGDNNGSGDTLMLEAPPDAGRPWASTSAAEIIDALPYIDDDYANPAVKLQVDRLIEDEMRRSSKKPSDFLQDLPPIPKLNFEIYVALQENIRRCVCIIYDPSKSNQGVLALKALKLLDSFMELYRSNSITGEKYIHTLMKAPIATQG